MNLNLHPVKHPAKMNVARKNYQAPAKKSTLQDPPPPTDRKKRVFGTNRCPNIPSKSTTVDKLPTKPSSGKNPVKKSPEIAVSRSKQEEETNKTKEKEKSSSLPRKNPAKSDRIVRPEDGPSTPARLPLYSMGRGRVAAATTSPFYTARDCRKSRFEDELETASYWLAQIRSAEAVGKHFVSASFFRLAADCKAEPMRSVRGELRRYLKRHEHLHSHEEWRLTCQSYGFVKDLDTAHSEA